MLSTIYQEAVAETNSANNILDCLFSILTFLLLVSILGHALIIHPILGGPFRGRTDTRERRISQPGISRQLPYRDRAHTKKKIDKRPWSRVAKYSALLLVYEKEAIYHKSLSQDIPPFPIDIWLFRATEEDMGERSG